MTMIRPISLLFLLANASMVLAQPLYKWVESDGSITFSPTPPASEVPFEKLDAQSPVAQSSLESSLEDFQVTRPATSDVNPAPPAKAFSRIEYAPGNAQDLPAAISRTPLQPVTTGLAVNRQNTAQDFAQDPAQAPAAPVDNDADQSASSSAASYKQSRCQDLRKRVTSLERRLKSRLSPEDMDNTVIHMARYQRSYDQYCAQ